ncbi:MAG: cytochrome c peroxidase, partial [Pseudomonadota bacterium]
MNNWIFRAILSFWFLLSLSACGGGGGGGSTPVPPPPPPPPISLDQKVRNVINAAGLTGDPSAGRTLPSINDPLAQLGKKLFFSKSLSGDMDTACASCHHPALGGGDGLSLPVGVGAVNPDVVGPGRTRADGLPNVGRHSQTVFNVGLYDAGLFWDSRVESIGKEAGNNGSASGIRTPDTPLNAADNAAGPNLVAAQARFPVAIEGEMRGTLLPGASDQAVRDRIAARLGDYGDGQGELTVNTWLDEFRTAFVSSETAENLVTFDNIALALGEYQRSMVFVDNPWRSYVNGDNNAISMTAKQGALLFLQAAGGQGDDRGLGCADCHSGDFFTDEDHHTIGFPQIGIGKGDEAPGDGDFGREQQTADVAHRFRFRTPSLLNFSVTAPYTHSGAYETFNATTTHYVVPRDTVDEFFDVVGGPCGLAQFAGHVDCPNLFVNSRDYTNLAVNKALAEQTSDPDHTFPDITSSPVGDAPLVEAFLLSLTDNCVSD